MSVFSSESVAYLLHAAPLLECIHFSEIILCGFAKQKEKILI